MPATTIKLTPYQAEEVQGLLDVCTDEAASSGDRTPWGSLTGRELTVTDAADAADDLRYRAAYLLDEGAVVGASGSSGARSLRALADKITGST